MSKIEQEPIAWRYKYVPSVWGGKGWVITDDCEAVETARNLGYVIESLYTHAAPCKRCDKPRLLLDGKTVQEFAGAELFDFQEATGCDSPEEARAKLATLEAKLQQMVRVVNAAENLEKQKGRYNTEIAYGLLMDALKEYREGK